MLGHRLLLPLNFLDAALAANHTYRGKLPFGVTLEAVSAACADSTSFILDIGTAADTDAYVDGVTVTGAAATSTLLTKANFVGATPVHIPADTEFVVSIDYDGGAGGDAADVSLTLVLIEG